MNDKVKIKLKQAKTAPRKYTKKNSENLLIFVRFHSSKFLELELPVTKCCLLITKDFITQHESFWIFLLLCLSCPTIEYAIT